MNNRLKAQSVLEHAKRASQKEDEFRKGGFHFVSSSGHILESLCRHEEGEGEKAGCSKCRYETELSLPELPEMVFPHNWLKISFANFPNSSIVFNALDALKRVDATTLPEIQVAPSAEWQEGSKLLENIRKKTDKNFDWTFTTHYKGTLNHCRAIESTDKIDISVLMRQDEISFYTNVTLFEDELADHGISEMSVKIRVMPTYFFVLARSYLRVDGVFIRVCDTRLFGEDNKWSVIREWSRREAKFEDLSHLSPDLLKNRDAIWNHLPLVEEQIDKIVPEAA
ncbi:hypothetical protein WR25_26718 [Diploscapter pachys]|uniref:TIP41-like protein n=1 Tax=Diploscapter pachys TaxID=2018661 RepID=A0A2A2KBG3_9BILA|nr:hypothetical protein WR25_26718 [Diploscapter pachys]